MKPRLEGRVISLEQARAERLGRRDGQRQATTNRFFGRIADATPPATAEQLAEGERAAAALIEYLNNGGGGDEAA